MIALIFFFIFILFIALVILRNYDRCFRWICAICGAISITWIGLLILQFLTLYDNLYFIALLIGQSILGIYYLVEKKLAKKYGMFRLPFLLTLTLIGYGMISVSGRLISSKEFLFGVLALSVLWIIFYIGHLLVAGGENANRRTKKR